MELNSAIVNMNPAIIRSVEAMFPTLYQRATLWEIGGSTVAADRRTAFIRNGLTVAVGRLVLSFPPQAIDLNVAANWDSVSTDYTVAATRAGKDFYIYATATGKLLLSANSTVPTGFDAGNSRRVGGFHCLCLSVGTIAGHTYTGFLTGDILASSIWDMSFRPVCSPQGMFYSRTFDIFVDIYVQSGTGVNTLSAFGATMTDTRTYWDHADDLAAVGKRMLSDMEFSVIAYGSPEGTNIFGSADPVTTGGHVDTANRRIISNLGAEDAVGVMYQWVDGGHIYRNDDAAYAGAWSWKSAGSRGQQYTQGANGAVGLLAGGLWSSGSSCGSRCRAAYYTRASAIAFIGSRGCARRQA